MEEKRKMRRFSIAEAMRAIKNTIIEILGIEDYKSKVSKEEWMKIRRVK